MDIKFGKVTPKDNFFTQVKCDCASEVNIFSQQSADQQKHGQAFHGQRLNDFDSNILESNAYQAIPDEMFKMEHKIGLLEESLAKLNNEISTLESFSYAIQVFELKNRRTKIEQELQDLKLQYSNMSLSAKISGQVVSAVAFASNAKSNTFSRLKNFLSKKVLAKMSKKFNCSQQMKEALDSLSDINLSVDELIQMQAPYGETINRYEKLTAYLNKANLIHSKISLNMNELAKKKV